MSALLTHEETMLLIAHAQNGDESAKETLIIKNIALIKSIVRGFLNRGIEYEDLFQIGTIGLIKAIEGYDNRFDVKFSTYAVPMIQGEIKRFLRDDGPLKVSRCIKERANKVFFVQESLKRKLGREPDLSEISKEIGCSKEEIIEAIDAVKEPISIYEPVGTEEKGKTQSLLLDLIAEEKEDGEKIIDRLLLKELLNTLDHREKKIILLRFFRDKTQNEIAEMIGVSQVQVSRIIGKTLKKMKDLAKK